MKQFKNIGEPAHVDLEWVKYHDIDIIGFIYYRLGDDRFQLITDKLIYFYKFENDEGEFSETPKIETVMLNFMASTSLMLDNDSKFSISYKSGQPNLNIFRRKYDHGFMEIFDNVKSREGCRGINLTTKDLFLMSDDNEIQVRNEKTFAVVSKVHVDLAQSDTIDEMEILNIKISPNEKYLAVLCGKNLIKEIEEVHSLHIFKMNDSGNDYSLLKVRELDERFREFSVTFEFKKDKQDESVIFTNLNQIMTYNFVTNELENMFDFENDLSK